MEQLEVIGTYGGGDEPFSGHLVLMFLCFLIGECGNRVPVVARKLLALTGNGDIDRLEASRGFSSRGQLG